MTTKLGQGLEAWRASADPGSPWCVSGGDDGISLNIYAYGDGGIAGVEVADGSNIVTGYGLVPFKKENS